MAHHHHTDTDSLYLELCVKLASYVMSACLRFTRNRQDAEDASQDFWLFLQTALVKYNPQQGDVLPWFKTTLRHFLISHFRPKKRRFHEQFLPLLTDDNTNTPIEVPDPSAIAIDPAVAAERAELRAALTAAIQKLPAKYRQVFSLFYGYDLSIKDIVDYYKQRGKVVPESTIKSHIHIARTKLRKRLGEYYH